MHERRQTQIIIQSLLIQHFTLNKEAFKDKFTHLFIFNINVIYY